MSVHREVRAGVVTRPVSFNQDIKALVPTQSLDPRFLTYSLLARGSQILRLVTSAGSGTGVLETGPLKRLPIWLPALSEQARVVKILDHVEGQVAALERLIAKKKAIKQGIMQQLLTGETRLPGFVGPWQSVVLGDVVSYVKTIALSRAQLDESSPLRYLHYGDIHTARTVVLDAAYMALPRATAALARTAGHLQVGDLVLVDASEDAAGVGKSLEITSVPSAGIVPGLHTIAARFDKAVIADGFKAYLQFIPTFRAALLRLAAGTKVLAITRSHISSVSLSLPNVDEQRAIALALRDCDTELDALHACLAKAKSIKQGMMRELLTGRTRLPVMEEATR